MNLIPVKQSVTALVLLSASSGMMVMSFPNQQHALLAWGALVPFFLLLRQATGLRGFIFGGTWGFLFFLGISSWIFTIKQISAVHVGLLAIYIFCWYGLFGFSFAWIAGRWSAFLALMAAPGLWVVLEYLRSNFFFLALPYGLIGHSQYRYTEVIQISSQLGAYSISFMIVMVNSALCAILSLALPGSGNKDRSESAPGGTRPIWLTSIFAIILVLSAVLYGHRVLQQPIPDDAVKIALVQANIDQTKKWDPQFKDEIIESYSQLTMAASRQQPHLIVWPETAAPGSVEDDRQLSWQLEHIVNEANTALLFGSARYDKFQAADAIGGMYRNAAYFITPKQNISMAQQYNKIRLFPFTEYLPHKDVIPWKLIDVSPVSEYAPGKSFTVFRHPAFVFSVTICWENLFPGVCRQFVKQGAQFIVNLTNEARFGRSAIPYQLMAISVFRAVENRRFVVRCANTGISCIIDPNGNIVDRVSDPSRGDIFVRGIVVRDIGLSESRSLYTQYGNLPMAVILTLLFSSTIWIAVKNKHGIHDSK